MIYPFLLRFDSLFLLIPLKATPTFGGDLLEIIFIQKAAVTKFFLIIHGIVVVVQTEASIL